MFLCDSRCDKDVRPTRRIRVAAGIARKVQKIDDKLDVVRCNDKLVLLNSLGLALGASAASSSLFVGTSTSVPVVALLAGCPTLQHCARARFPMMDSELCRAVG